MHEVRGQKEVSLSDDGRRCICVTEQALGSLNEPTACFKVACTSSVRFPDMFSFPDDHVSQDFTCSVFFFPLGTLSYAFRLFPFLGFCLAFSPAPTPAAGL